MKAFLILIVLILPVRAEEIPHSAQAKLIKTLLEQSGKDWSGVKIGIASNNADEAGKFKAALAEIQTVKLGGKDVPLSAEVIPADQVASFKDQVLYVFPGVKPSDSVLTIVNNPDQLDSGAAIGLVREVTTPRIFLNLKQLEKLGISFPAPILKMARTK